MIDAFSAAPTLALLGATVCVLAAKTVPALQPLLRYGKTWHPAEGPYSWLLNLTVPKAWFWHFYALLFGLAWYLPASARRNMLLIQGLRRLSEQLVLFGPSAARMHVSHYLVGLVFYFLQSTHQSTRRAKILPLLIFMLASAGQCICHWTLAHTKKYSRPEFFVEAACPHYFFEILVYFGLWLHDPSPFTLATVVWVAVDLGVSAFETRNFYITAGQPVSSALFPLIA